MSLYNLSFKSSVQKDLKQLPHFVHQLVFKKIGSSAKVVGSLEAF
jgi:hypothetical protein